MIRNAPRGKLYLRPSIRTLTLLIAGLQTLALSFFTILNGKQLSTYLICDTFSTVSTYFQRSMSMLHTACTYPTYMPTYLTLSTAANSESSFVGSRPRRSRGFRAGEKKVGRNSGYMVRKKKYTVGMQWGCYEPQPCRSVSFCTVVLWAWTTSAASSLQNKKNFLTVCWPHAHITYLLNPENKTFICILQWKIGMTYELERDHKIILK